MNKPGFKELFADARNSFEYALDKVIWGFTKRVAFVLKEKELSKRDLAKKMGCSAPNISKVFSGSPNLTVATMLKIARAIDCDLEIELRPKDAKTQLRATTIFQPLEADGFANRLLHVKFGADKTVTSLRQISTEKNADELSVAA